MTTAASLPLFQQYQLQFAAHIRNPHENPKPRRVAAKRMRVYKDIVFANIEAALANCFPVCKRVIGKRLWHKLIRGFFIHHQSHSPLFRQIPEEFLRYLEQVDKWADSPAIPCYFKSLAHYEWVELAISSSEAAIDTADVDVTGDLLKGLIVPAPTLELLSYDYPVHQISPKNRPTEALVHPVYLAVYRDSDDEVRFVEINQMTYVLLQKIKQSSMSGESVLSEMAIEMQYPTEQLIEFGLPILQDLRAQQMILGTRH
jgi:uncharacterized protein